MMPKEPRSGKTQVTMSEYLALVGLLELAKRYNDKLKDIERAVAEIVDEKAWFEEDYGHTSDAVYCLEPDADELLKKLDLEILPGDNS